MFLQNEHGISYIRWILSWIGLKCSKLAIRVAEFRPWMRQSSLYTIAKGKPLYARAMFLASCVAVTKCLVVFNEA